MRQEINDSTDYSDPYVGIHNIESLVAYGASGRRTGGFLEAMLQGDLYAAAGRADIFNQQRIFYIAQYIENHLPKESYGTPEKVAQWLKRN